MSDSLPLDALSAHLAREIPFFGTLREARKTTSGQSNPTFVLGTDAAQYVLRKKPAGNLLRSAHAIDREFRVMRALANSAVPVPQMLYYCEEPDLLGTPFYVMSFVDGASYSDPRCPRLSVDARARVYDSMNQTLAALHSVDPAALGLEDFGREGAYFARQLSRWTEQYRATQTEELGAMEELIAWLGAHLPDEQGPPRLVHGDWRIDNLIFSRLDQSLSAVLDWELATLGNPLADLGAQLMQWAMPPGEEGRGLRGVARRAKGLPEDHAYVEDYARRVGLSTPPDMRFPVAFAFFRMAAILQGVKKRGLDGNASNPLQAKKLGRMIPVYAQSALDYLEHSA
ncbi:MAG: phosphotransferase family protein [Pseudomonadota bacterium]